MRFITGVAAVAAVLTSTVSAQYAIDPDSVSNSTRQAWCEDQETQCPLICLQTPAASAETISNTCDWTTLTYSCVCSNGQSPNETEYSQTLPFFICQEWGNQCVANCGGNTACASACREDHPCGALDPTRHNASTVTTTMMTSTTTALGSGSGGTVDGSGQTIYTGFAGSPAASSGGSGSGNSGGGGGGGSSAASSMVRVWTLSAGQTIGSFLVFGSMTLGFAILL